MGAIEPRENVIVDIGKSSIPVTGSTTDLSSASTQAQGVRVGIPWQFTPKFPPLPSYSFMFFSDAPVSTVQSIEMVNAGSAFISVFAANLQQTRSWMTESKQPRKDLQRWQVKQAEMFSQWCTLVPETQMLTIRQYLQQDQKSIEKTRKFSLSSLSQQAYQKLQGPFHLFAVCCRPFVDLCDIEIASRKESSVQIDLSKASVYVGLRRLVLVGTIRVPEKSAFDASIVLESNVAVLPAM